MNTTSDSLDDTAAIGIFLIPIFLGVLFYLAMVLCLWPYARPIFPFGFLFLLILFPPIFPFLLIYVLFFTLYASPPVSRRVIFVSRTPSSIAIVEPATRGRVRPATVITSASRV